ncbi:hypothetical protein [Micromonospora sp. CPCC 206061]|uniref:hypothetical protein n=1 Tax=Micromonospora sp. CPCC 206061 TaxID=3122410 RepID=UPI002FF33287
MSTDRDEAIADTSLKAFSTKLRHLYDQAGAPTQQTLATRARCSRTVVWQALNGKRLPSWDITERIVVELGGDATEWRSRWAAARRHRDTADESTDPGVAPEPAVPPAATTSPRPRRHYDGHDARQLLAAADALADALRLEWDRVAHHRRLLLPAPIPLRWQNSEQPVTGPLRETLACTPVGHLFAPLPGIPPVTAETVRSGDLEEVFTVYGGLRSGRMLILGEPGSGKSATALLTMITALRHRRDLDDAERGEVPVPVLLTARSWDPRRQHIDDWLAESLARDFPFLLTTQYGPNAPRRLVRAGRIALFLDGFDEMVPELRAVALEALNRQATFRLVMMARTDELVAAVGACHLYGAVALELLPIPVYDAASYLTRCALDSAAAPQQQLIERLQEKPESAFAQALDSPLNLTLVRDAFPAPSEIDELLDERRFGSRAEIDRYLLDRVVRVEYEPPPIGRPGPYRLEVARACLEFLASTMNERRTRDLAWWRMHHWASPFPRILAAGGLGLVINALVGVLVFGPLGEYTVRGTTGARFGLVYGAAMGLTFGLFAGLVSELRDATAPWAARIGRGTAFAARPNLAIASLVGLSTGIAVANQTFYILGPPVGIAVGLASARAARRVLPRRNILLRVDPTTVLAAGLPIGLSYGVTKGLMAGLVAGLVSGCGFGLMVGFARPSDETDLAVAPETSWRRDRGRSLTFALAAGLTFGIPLGLGNGFAHGLVPGILAGIGFGGTIACGGLVGASNWWRTNLAFLQLRRNPTAAPLSMRFLQDAHAREILRSVGPVYQFRHARLQDRLADSRRPRRAD